MIGLSLWESYNRKQQKGSDEMELVRQYVCSVHDIDLSPVEASVFVSVFSVWRQITHVWAAVWRRRRLLGLSDDSLRMELQLYIDQLLIFTSLLCPALAPSQLLHPPSFSLFSPPSLSSLRVVPLVRQPCNQGRSINQTRTKVSDSVLSMLTPQLVFIHTQRIIPVCKI